MKKLLSIFLIMFISSNLFSQAWTKKLPQTKSKNELTFFDYKSAFEKYWEPFNVSRGYYFENGIKKKARGWKQFKRWEYNMENQINPTTGEFPKNTAQEIYKEYLLKNPQLKSEKSIGWTNLGTNSSDGGYAGIGRISCIAFHPTDINTYWVGAAAGGLWVTYNNGTSWTCLTDNNGVLAISDIIIPSDYSTSNTIYIATGDRDSWDNNSIGVLKSTNGGTTWNSTGLSYTISAGEMVNKILIDPSNNQILLAATSSGLYKTTDGGDTWSTKLSTYIFNDLKYKPGDFNTLYASNKNGKIYLSTNGGSTWTIAFSNTNAYRIELAVSENQPTWVYAVVVDASDGLYGVYKSINSGASFSQTLLGTNLNLLGYDDLGNDTGGQGWYDLTIAASPLDANIVVIGGVNTWKSTDGGLNWTLITHWSGSTGVQTVHADKHMLKYRTNGNLFECNDGGVYISSNNGSSWTDKTNGMIISQMYKLGVSQTNSSEIITGLQDNGTKLRSNGTWSDVKGGDGMECIIDYSDVNIQYGTYVSGQITRTTNHWNSTVDIEPTAAGEGAWVTPYIIDPNNPQILYAGYADVWKTANRGDSWTQISTMNTSDKIRSMAIAPSNSQILYVADRTTIWKTINGGTSWTDITGTLPTSAGNITSIAVKNDNANTVWITLSGYTSNNIYESTNAGTSWTNISTGLPQIPAYSVVQNKQSTSEVNLYVGTELGVYFKKGTDNWIAYNTNLPNVKIGEIEIFYASAPENSLLRAATYGRGLWEIPVYYAATPMNFVSCTTTQNNVSSISPNQTNQEIIGIQIETTGSLTPLNVSSFTFNTNGTTSASTDISNAKLFYSGTSNSFSTSTQFGTTKNSPNGVFTITGTQDLENGINYFWLTYDVPSSATLDNYLDAECTSITVGTAKTPSITNPSGSRKISNTYCTASSLSSAYEYISNVTIENIVQNSTSLTYEDYTSQIIELEKGKSSSISVGATSAYSTDELLIWIDWNQDNDFDDADESIYKSTTGAFTYTTSITPPATALLGITRMRIRLHDSTDGPNSTSCGTSSWGEVEDYSVNVNYCSATSSSNAFEYISNVTMENINQSSGDSKYEDYTSQVINTEVGVGSNISIDVTSPYTSDELSIWIDWNFDGDFEDINENVYSSGAVGLSNYTTTITPALNSILGTTRMRIRVYDSSYNSKNPCGSTSYGEVEDYSISIKNTLSADNKIEKNKTINIYPNPVSNQLIIENNEINKTLNFEILNSIGQVVFKGVLNDKTIVETSEFAKGVYLVKINNNNQSEYQKIIKQ